MQGNYLVVDLDRQLFVAEVRKKEGQRSKLSLPIGSYAIKKRTDTHLLLQKLQAREKGVYHVDEAKMEMVSFDEDYAKGTPILRKVFEKEDTEFSLSIGLDGQAILFENDVTKQGTLFPSIGFVSLEARLSNLIANNFTLGGDIAFGSRRHTVHVEGGTLGSFDFAGQYSQIQLGTSLLYDFAYKDLTFSTGPRLAFLLVHRVYDDAPIASQSLPAFTPGLVAMVGYHPFDWLHVEGTLRSSYLLYTEDNFQHLAVTEGLLSVWMDL
ncbi:MAG: hypothetical protein GY822_11125 [Deltaproteobacteria bacterium]|nr:hypothetical protein [Deltaproteobacteria bacterium]